jgi:hypothetical protein
LKAAERRGQEFHAIQIRAQAFKRLDQIVDDHFLGWFRHHHSASIPQASDHPINIFSWRLNNSSHSGSASAGQPHSRHNLT